jgi:hypothetical protein
VTASPSTLDVDHLDPPVPARRMSWRLAKFAGLLLTANLVCWYAANFLRVAPLSEDWRREFALHFAFVASGPFAFLSGSVEAWPAVLVACVVVAPLLVAAVRGRRFVVARWAGYVGVSMWFLFGVSVVGSRIT